MPSGDSEREWLASEWALGGVRMCPVVGGANPQLDESLSTDPHRWEKRADTYIAMCIFVRSDHLARVSPIGRAP